MKSALLYLFGLLTLAFTACSSNQDLARLDEYDDVYYHGGGPLLASKAPESTSDDYNGASNAEQSYYGNGDYAYDAEDKPTEPDSEADYYDPDYARRIQNFQYNEDDNYAYNQNNYGSNPNVNVNLGFGFGSYYPYGPSYGYGGIYYPMRPNFSLGFNYGFSTSAWIGYPYSPYFSPWYNPYPYFAYYDPFYYPYYSPYRPWYNPYNPYGYYGGGYYGGGYYGGGYYPGGYTDGSYTGVSYGSRSSSGATRPSRGGVIQQNNDQVGTQRPGLNGKSDDVRQERNASVSRSEKTLSPQTGKEELTEREVRRERPDNPQTSRQDDYFNQREATEYRQPRETRDRPTHSYSRPDTKVAPQPTRQDNATRSYSNTRIDRGTISPSSGEQRNRTERSRSQRSSYGNSNDTPSRSYSYPSRSNSRNSGGNNYNHRQSTPSSSPSYSSPSRSRSTGGNNGSSSPSRRR